MVGDFLNRALPFRVFKNGKHHIEDVLLLDNGLYVFKMRSEEACLAILGKGPYYILLLESG